VTKKLDGTWTQWLKENLDRKCSPEELLGILIKNGFALKSIRQHMGLLFPANSPLLKDIPDDSANNGPDINYRAIANCRITRPDSGLNAYQVLTDKLQLYVLDSFLSDEECDRIIKLSSNNLRPSTVTTGIVTYRTSRTCDIFNLNDPYVDELEEKIANALGIRKSYSEKMQVHHYEVGQFFKEHVDYFGSNSDTYVKHTKDLGQRTWTFMIYLNDDMTGGGTKMFAIDRIFTPKKGMALVWNNLDIDGNPNPNTQHSGLPVESGRKIILTKWFRELGTGPMFYDDQPIHISSPQDVHDLGAPSSLDRDSHRKSDHLTGQKDADTMRNARYAALIAIQRDLARMSANAYIIERRSGVFKKEFLDKYYATNRPVILCDLMHSWKALEKWTPEYLKATCSFETTRNNFFSLPRTSTLLEDIEMFPEYLEKTSGDDVSLWYGTKGTITPFHYEPMNILRAQVQGRTQIKLIPANEIEFINHSKEFSQVDPVNPDYEKFPEFRLANVLDLELAAGEVLFLPVGWWHWVKVLDDSITVSFSNFLFHNEFNLANGNGQAPQ
jgi:prolyl 4-hydroxylase